MGKSTVTAAILSAMLAVYGISFMLYKREHYYTGLGPGPNPISTLRWRVPDTAVHRTLMTIYWPLRQLPWFKGPIDWI